MRKFKARIPSGEKADEKGKEVDDTVVKGAPKRRAEAVAGEFVRVARRSKSEVVPNRGLPNQ